MGQAPGGIVVLLFTDLVGSTPLLERLGEDEAETLRREHFRLLRDAVAARGGYEVKNAGDGLMVAFPSAVDALACAVAMQQGVHRHNVAQPVERQLKVRVGLHAGEPMRERTDYFGMPVVVARRLCDQALGDQIIASQVVRDLVGSRGGYTFCELGAMALKGIAEPVAAWEVAWEPLADGVPSQGPVSTAEVSRALPPLLVTGERTAFVGRERELSVLRAGWARALSGQPQLVLLAGDPGIGKTRLAAEFARLAHDDGATVLFGRCEEEAIVACQPFVEALRCYADFGLRASAEADRIAEELAKPLAEDAAETGAQPQGPRPHVVETVAHWLSEASKVAPLVFVLDDLHWADRATLQLLRHTLRAARSATDAPLLVLGTYRETDLARTHPLSELLADLRRERGPERLSLKGLGRGEVGAMIGAWAGRKVPEPVIQAVHQQTEGNPFFIEEVLRHLAETGVIVQDGEQPAADLTIASMAVPESVKEVIGRRLARLSEPCNSVLTIASVIGREFGLDALERASDLASERLLELVEEALAARVIAEVPGSVGRYSFAHSLIYETLYEELTTTRRVRLHGQQLRYADSNGVKLAYEVLGAAGPHVIVVGISNCPAVRSRSRVAARHWEPVARSRRVVLYDRRGVGCSAAPERGYSVLAGVEDVRSVLDAVGAERAVVWGVADGGPLAITFAAMYPERVAGLLLLGTTAKYLSSDDFAAGVGPAVVESFLRLDSVDRGRAVSELYQTRPGRSGVEAISDVMARVPPRVWSKVLRGVAGGDARSLLPRVRAPTLIIHDPGNAYIPVEAARYLHEHIAGSRLEITEEYGAYPFGEYVYRMIETFIDEVTALRAP